MKYVSQITQVFTIKVQAAILIALCLGSIATLFFDFFATRIGPERQREVREDLTKACLLMATKAEPLEESLTDNSTDDRLGSIAGDSLASVPGAEGGFYLATDDRFTGYAFPSRPRPPGDRHRNEPPPLEAPYIRLQAKDSLSAAAGQTHTSVRDVEASQVMIVTAPIGNARPAPFAAWVMYRLVDPRTLTNQVRRYQTSTALGVVGLILAALLLVNLGRLLRQQRAKETQLREELRRSEHLAALGKLLAGVAHEVRNPLAAIRSTVQLWERLPESKNAASMSSIVDAVDRLNQTVTQLLYFSRSDQSERATVQVNDLIESTIELNAAQAASQGVTIERTLDVDAPVLSVAPRSLSQAIVNLIQNSLQAMPSGGNLKVVSEWDSRQRALVIQIADSGSGISADIHQRMFEPFFTTRAEGTGLGLSLCREIIEQHGGRLEYFDNKPNGALFQITLPK